MISVITRNRHKRTPRCIVIPCDITEQSLASLGYVRLARYNGEPADKWEKLGRFMSFFVEFHPVTGWRLCSVPAKGFRATCTHHLCRIADIAGLTKMMNEPFEEADAPKAK